MDKLPDVTLTLSGDAALVLDAALSRSDDLGRGPSSVPEQIALLELDAELERRLTATFAPDYDAVLQAARQRLVSQGGALESAAPPAPAGWMCCFCGQHLADAEAGVAELHLATGDGGTQALRCHSRCLRRQVHPRVPLL
jgi:hypothetical protein